jgi:hypothetical protein
MKNGKQATVVTLLAHAAFLSIYLSAAVAGGSASSIPGAQELLDKYTQALDLLRSTILNVETSEEHDGAFDRNWVDPMVRGTRDKGTTSTREEYRTDGARFHSRAYRWGHISPHEPAVPEERANYQCRNWDGTQYYQHTRKINAPELPGSVNLLRPAEKYQLWPRNPPMAYIMGYNLASDERLDSILRKAKRLSVRPETETIGGAECYVLDAVTDKGDMSLWIDPTHGFHPAKVECTFSEGDRDYDLLLKKGERRASRLENVKFKLVENAWMPVEADVHLRKNFGGGDNYVDSRYHCRITEVLLNPDHETLGSFVNPLDRPGNDPELRNGTWVCKAGERDKQIWQDGKLVPDERRSSTRPTRPRP